MRLGVLDLGSNSFHLTAFWRTSTALVPRQEGRRIVRLGAAIREGAIEVLAFSRGLDAMGELLGELEQPCPVVAVATSAIREARNGAAFCQAVARRYGIEVEVLSGEEEARLTYAGARVFAGPTGRLAVVDLGGGSLEMASG